MKQNPPKPKKKFKPAKNHPWRVGPMCFKAPTFIPPIARMGLSGT